MHRRCTFGTAYNGLPLGTLPHEYPFHPRRSLAYIHPTRGCRILPVNIPLGQLPDLLRIWPGDANERHILHGFIRASHDYGRFTSMSMRWCPRCGSLAQDGRVHTACTEEYDCYGTHIDSTYNIPLPYALDHAGLITTLLAADEHGPRFICQPIPLLASVFFSFEQFLAQCRDVHAAHFVHTLHRTVSGPEE